MGLCSRLFRAGFPVWKFLRRKAVFPKGRTQPHPVQRQGVKSDSGFSREPKWSGVSIKTWWSCLIQMIFIEGAVSDIWWNRLSYSLSYSLSDTELFFCLSFAPPVYGIRPDASVSIFTFYISLLSRMKQGCFPFFSTFKYMYEKKLFSLSTGPAGIVCHEACSMYCWINEKIFWILIEKHLYLPLLYTKF
jgi:hypothetical protein